MGISEWPFLRFFIIKYLGIINAVARFYVVILHGFILYYIVELLQICWYKKNKYLIISLIYAQYVLCVL